MVYEINYLLYPEKRRKVERTLIEAGFVLREDPGSCQYGFRVFDPKLVKLDDDCLVADDGYVGELNTKRVDARSNRGIEEVLKKLNLPKY